GGNWDAVINLAASTKYSQGKEVLPPSPKFPFSPPQVYDANIVTAAKRAADCAAKHKVKRIIHVSTAQVYEAGKVPRSSLLISTHSETPQIPDTQHTPPKYSEAFLEATLHFDLSSPEQKPSNEDGKLKPWTGIAVAHAEAENLVKA